MSRNQHINIACVFDLICFSLFLLLIGRGLSLLYLFNSTLILQNFLLDHVDLLLPLRAHLSHFLLLQLSSREDILPFHVLFGVEILQTGEQPQQAADVELLLIVVEQSYSFVVDCLLYFHNIAILSSYGAVLEHPALIDDPFLPFGRNKITLFFELVC